jgi:hypothetical protein
VSETKEAKPTRAEQAREAWRGLNVRQQAYLEVVYNADQAEEQARGAAAAAGHYGRPASEWRWLEYGPVGNAYGKMGWLQEELDRRGLRDQGAGATFKVLADQKLVKLKYDPGLIVDAHMAVQITP